MTTTWTSSSGPPSPQRSRRRTVLSVLVVGGVVLLALLLSLRCCAPDGESASVGGGAPAAAGTPELGGPLLWSAGHEGGTMSEWESGDGGGVFDSGRSGTTVSADVAHTGRYSAKLTISTPPDSGTRLFRWQESNSYPDGVYYGAWIYFPMAYETGPGWTNLMQFKSRKGQRNDPFWIIGYESADDGSMYLNLFYWQTEGARPGEPGRKSFAPEVRIPIPVRQWFHLETFLRQSGQYSGEISVWQDGVRLFAERGVRTKFVDGDQGWSVNNYAGEIVSKDVTIYVDDAMVSRESTRSLTMVPAPTTAAGRPR